MLTKEQQQNDFKAELRRMIEHLPEIYNIEVSKHTHWKMTDMGGGYGRTKEGGTITITIEHGN